MASMQVGVSGQTFFKQGLQGKSFLTTRLIPPQGPVRLRLVDPKRATRGICKAEAACINPESLQIINRLL